MRDRALRERSGHEWIDIICYAYFSDGCMGVYGMVKRHSGIRHRWDLSITFGAQTWQIFRSLCFQILDRGVVAGVLFFRCGEIAYRCRRVYNVARTILRSHSI